MKTENYGIVLSILLFISINNLFAQELPPIQLDRPDQTECPFITPKKYIQVENGFNIENTYGNQRIFTYPSTLWKYGVNEKFELRLITEIISFNGELFKDNGILPITVGFKTSLLEEKGIIPKISFIGHFTTAKIGSKKYQSKYPAPSFRFTMQHTLSKKFIIAYNLGAEWNGYNADPTYIYTLTNGLSITDNLGAYAELYGYISTDYDMEHNIDGGFTYLINNNLIADISAGISLNNIIPQNYISLGLSFRFNTASKNKNRLPFPTYLR
jgi:hypothetical protein